MAAVVIDMLSVQLMYGRRAQIRSMARVMGWVLEAGARPEGCQHGRAAHEVLPIEASHRQAEGALGGDAVAQRVAAVAPVCDADSVGAQTPYGGLERIATCSPFIAELVACLQCT